MSDEVQGERDSTSTNGSLPERRNAYRPHLMKCCGSCLFTVVVVEMAYQSVCVCVYACVCLCIYVRVCEILCSTQARNTEAAMRVPRWIPHGRLDSTTHLWEKGHTQCSLVLGVLADAAAYLTVHWKSQAPALCRIIDLRGV
jgi:hypothetical protein